MTSIRSPLRTWQSYLVAMAIVGAATAIRLIALQSYGTRAPYLTFYPAVMLAALCGGFPAGILATVLSALMAGYWWIEPIGQIKIKDHNDMLGLFVFLASCTMISCIVEAMQRAQARARKAVLQAELAAEREIAEDAILQSESRFRSIFNNSPIAIGIGRSDNGRIVEVNNAWIKMFGFEREEAIGRTTAELNLYVMADERDEIVRLISECGRVINREIRLRRKTGEIIVVQGSAEIIMLGEESFLQVMTTDITERKRNEAAREATVELLRICNRAESLPDLMQDLTRYFRKLSGCEAVGVRLRDGHDFPYYVTEGFSEEFVLAEKHLCSYDRDGELIRDYVGHPVLDCMCGNILCDRIDPAKPFFTPHGSFWSSCTSELLANTTEAERRAKTRNRCNSEGFESVALIPLRYRNETYGLFQFNGRARGRFTPENIALYEELVDYVSIALSKLKSDEALRESKKRLREKNAELERFTYMISHDLKSPLITVKTFLGYLEHDLGEGNAERVGQDLHYMRGAAESMERMLDELLELSRVGRMSNAPQSCKFRELAESALEMVAGRIAQRGVKAVVADIDVVLYGDRPRLLEIWQNLVENACKFMGDQAQPAIEIGVETHGMETVFYVRDNGAGIEPPYQEKIFGLFEKLDRNIEGSGLGLALVRRIVEMYAGRIWVESQGAGHGSCFRFTLPGAVKDQG